MIAILHYGGICGGGGVFSNKREKFENEGIGMWDVDYIVFIDGDLINWHSRESIVQRLIQYIHLFLFNKIDIIIL